MGVQIAQDSLLLTEKHKTVFGAGKLPISYFGILSLELPYCTVDARSLAD